MHDDKMQKKKKLEQKQIDQMYKLILNFSSRTQHIDGFRVGRECVFQEKWI